MRLPIKNTVYQFVPEDQGKAGIGEMSKAKGPKTKAEDRPNASVETSNSKCTIERGASQFEAEIICSTFIYGNIYILSPVEAKIIVLWTLFSRTVRSSLSALVCDSERNNTNGSAVVHLTPTTAWCYVDERICRQPSSILLSVAHVFESICLSLSVVTRLGTLKRAIQLLKKVRAIVVAMMSRTGQTLGHLVNQLIAVRSYLKTTDCGSGSTMSR
ncbi:hypothetical protein T11_10724 [Trichinella zimbabwensis]|uniref:Uncharacterized protein n=1 Tax=Trichinella zimbabwensis TaxID=268475 RepID=A0A0V1HIE4_9BILA|nr:hypothetical protein T11_10724 [Trichinella zimbabwensis]